MVVAVLAGCLGLLAVLLALYAEPQPRPPRGARASFGVQPVPVASLPSPQDLRPPDFRLRPLGYDPVGVDVHVEMLRRAYRDLYAEATPEVLARAAQRRSGAARAPAAAPEGPGQVDERAGVEDDAVARTVTGPVDADPAGNTDEPSTSPQNDEGARRA